MRTAAVLAGVVGGLCWVAAPWVELLAPVGLGLLAVAVLGAGAGLVSSGATWLRVIVAVCFLALVGSVLSVLRDGLDDQALLVAGGVVAVVLAVVAMARRPASRGTHSL